jgi:hypothetical protein
MKIENGLYLIGIEPETGRIESILDRRSNIELISEPRLADNFRLLLPTPELEANYVLGAEQPLTSISRNGRGATLRWDAPLKNAHGEFDVDVVMQIAFVNEAVEFRLSVDNRSDFNLAEAWGPILGGLTGYGGRENSKLMLPHKGWSTAEDLFTTFPLTYQYGAPYPECKFQYPYMMPMPWFDIYNPRCNRGVYVGCHDLVPRIKFLRFELQPGIQRGKEGNWPTPDKLDDDTPMGLTTNWVAMPWSAPRSTFEAPPVVVRFHEGDWRSAAEIYRAWFASHFAIADPTNDWLRRETSFQTAMILLQEGTVFYAYKDIPEWARDALEYGVRSVLLCGWDKGGHDADYPHYEPDPRLGNLADLKDAIDACHDMGMRVFLFVNIQPVDCTTDLYREDLYRYRSVGRWGHPRNTVGYGMGTLGGRTGITHRPLGDVNPAFPEVRELLVRQFRGLAEIGADGLHIDKVDDPLFDFNENLDASPDRASTEGLLKTIEETFAACRQVNPDFALSTECRWDHMLRYSSVAWSWHSHALGIEDHVPVLKYTFSQWLPAMAIDQPYDYQLVNAAVRFGYQLKIGPGFFTSSMGDRLWKGLSAYIQEVERIRAELKETIFHGEYLHTFGVRIEASDGVVFSTHRNPKTGKRACALVNQAAYVRHVSVDGFSGGGGPVRIYEPFKPVRTATLPLNLDLPAERFALVVEE